MKTTREQLTFRMILVSTVLFLTGCSMYHSASMRVDVDLYKGPLTKSIELQLGELAGESNNIARQFESFASTGNGIETFAAYESKCKTLKPETLNEIKAKMIDCQCIEMIKNNTCKSIINDFKEITTVAEATNENNDVEIIHKSADGKKIKNINGKISYAGDDGIFFIKNTDEKIIYKDTNREQIIYNFNKIYECVSNGSCNGNNTELKKQLLSLSNYATCLKTEAMNEAYFMNTWDPDLKEARILAANYANLMAEASNQIGSRADALLKQLGGKKAEKLPLSVLLRDTSPTSFLNMYTWNDAMEHGYSAEERVRSLEHHFADHYWSRINSVVAIGQDSVGMAFVKDDIGNWNLKNFESDPTNMISAYKEVGVSALQFATKVLTENAATPGIDTAKALLKVANQVNFGGGTGEQTGNLDTIVKNIHERTSERIQSIINESNDKYKNIAPADDDARARKIELVASTKSRIDTILFMYEQTLTELAQAGSTSATKNVSGTTLPPVLSR